jgi:uncharacterized protein YqgC (DUF456 family)
MWTTIAITILLLSLLAGWVLTLLGLPGNWLIVLVAAGYAAWGPEETRATMALSTVLLLLILAVLGEVLEFVLGAAAAKRAGGSRRAAVGALAGGLAGAVAGMFVGLPIPIVGSLLATVLFAAIGALGGAFAAQRSTRKWEEAQRAWQVGKAAFWGRLGGTAAKIVVGTIMVFVGVAALLVQ